jgi:hypothetical protein
VVERSTSPSLAVKNVFADAALSATRAVFERMGAQVKVGPELENLVRATDEGVCVESEGLPNLVHELVHALEAGVLADDHAFPYCEIPLNPRDVGHRRYLWDELCCCILSCAFVPEEQVDTWFAEQVEIQPVFYGLEAEPTAWVRLVDALLSEFSDEFDRFHRVAGDRLRDALSAAGETKWLSEVPWRAFRTTWSRYRDRTLAGA